MKTYTIRHETGVIRGHVSLPASKSISNRLLMIAEMCQVPFKPDNLSVAEDTLLLQKLLDLVRKNREAGKVVELDTLNAGTVMRFLAAYLALVPGTWMLTGSDRMKQRPVGVLVEALIQLGASVDYLGKPGYPPLLIKGRQLFSREIAIDPTESSQFASALLMIAPLLPEGLCLRLTGKPVSLPYIRMTLKLMEKCGIKISENKGRIRIHPGSYKPVRIRVESDWSAASFWYEVAALSSHCDIFLEGLDEHSLQGDAVLPGIFTNFGVKTSFSGNGILLQNFKTKPAGFYFDFSDHPDLAQPVIAICAGLNIRGRFEGLGSLHIKETDRMRAMKHELEKLGVNVKLVGPGPYSTALELEPSRLALQEHGIVETYGDHRMAMTFAPLALVSGAMKIRNPDVVGKSYPDFWDHLRQVGFIVSS
jgi:3-phosphoshikimate 1-carboxyvinyltransferase